jgi:hypothetical protein
MKLFLKILFFIFIMITTVGEGKSSTVVNILQKEISYSFHQEPQFCTNHFENTCLNREKVVAYSERVISIEANAAEGGSSDILLNISKQLQAKFKHASDFGVVGNYNKANAGKFTSAINQHINSVGVQSIQGTYRGQSVIHYLNPNTGLNVISSPSGHFISGWKLNPAQLQNVLKHGGL